MANTMTIGRVTFTSPNSIKESSIQSSNLNNLDRDFSFSGSICEDTIAATKKLRDELISMGNSDLILPITYEGDTTLAGYGKITSMDVSPIKLATGYFSYSIGFEMKGRTSEMIFESNMSGALLTNSHSVTTGNTTYAPWHALPVNAFNYKNDSLPTPVTRASEDGNVALFYDSDLRSYGSNWIVEPADFYKGAAKITGVEISNGIIKITSGSTTDQSRFSLSFYDNGSWTSTREIEISSGSSQTEWNVWQTVQILRNEPQECVVRFVTYSDDTYKDGRLTVDVSVKRGAHHASLVISESVTSTRSADTRKNLRMVTSNAMSAGTGYIVESSADGSGQKFMIGSPQGFTAVASSRLIHLASSQVKTFVGYVYNASSPAAHNAGDVIRNQYLEGLYENIRLVRA